MQILGVTQQNAIAFFDVMGALRLEELKMFGKIGGYFADFFPLIIPVVSLLFVLVVLTKLTSLFQVSSFEANDKATQDTIASGKELLNIERVKRGARGYDAHSPTSPPPRPSRVTPTEQQQDDDESADDENAAMIQKHLQDDNDDDTNFSLVVKMKQ